MFSRADGPATVAKSTLIGTSVALVGTTMNVTSVVLPGLPSMSDPGVVVAVPIVVVALDTVVLGLDRVLVSRLVVDIIVELEVVDVVVLEGAGEELTIVALKRGVASSSRIVPRPLPSPISAFTGFDRRTPIVSSFSFVVSPTI